jgi:hypothetical protein
MPAPTRFPYERDYEAIRTVKVLRELYIHEQLMARVFNREYPFNVAPRTWWYCISRLKDDSTSFSTSTSFKKFPLMRFFHQNLELQGG